MAVRYNLLFVVSCLLLTGIIIVLPKSAPSAIPLKFQIKNFAGTLDLSVPRAAQQLAPSTQSAVSSSQVPVRLTTSLPSPANHHTAGVPSHNVWSPGPCPVRYTSPPSSTRTSSTNLQLTGNDSATASALSVHLHSGSSLASTSTACAPFPTPLPIAGHPAVSLSLASPLAPAPTAQCISAADPVAAPTTLSVSSVVPLHVASASAPSLPLPDAARQLPLSPGLSLASTPMLSTQASTSSNSPQPISVASDFQPSSSNSRKAEAPQPASPDPVEESRSHSAVTTSAQAIASAEQPSRKRKQVTKSSVPNTDFDEGATL